MPPPPRRLRPRPPPPRTRQNETPTQEDPSGSQDAMHPQGAVLGKGGPRRTRPRRRGRRAGAGTHKSKAGPSLPPNNVVASGGGSDKDSPTGHDTPAFSNTPSPEPTGSEGGSSLNTVCSEEHDHPLGQKSADNQLGYRPTFARSSKYPTADSYDIRSSVPATTKAAEWPSSPSLASLFGRNASRPAYIGSHLPISTVNLPETKPFSLATPDFGGAEFTPPTPYNPDYPHPLTAYASPGVNPATVSASGYAPRLRELQETDPRSVTGGILADCNVKMTAPALSVTPGNKDGCGIPEKLWLQLSACASVKVPIGAVLPAVLAGRGLSPRFLQNATSHPSHSDAHNLTSPPGPKEDVRGTPVLPTSSFGQPSRLGLSRSETDLQQMLSANSESPSITRVSSLSERRGSLPDLRLGSLRSPAARHELSRLPASPSPRRLYHSTGGTRRKAMAEEELLREILSAQLGSEMPPSESSANSLNRLPRLNPHRSLGSLSTVEEAEDDHRSTATPVGRQIEPIGSERSFRGQLPTLPLSLHRTPQVEEEDYAVRPALSRRSSYDFSIASSSGPSTGIFPPVEFSHAARSSATLISPSGDLTSSQISPPPDSKQPHSLLGSTTPHSPAYDASPHQTSSPSAHDEIGFLDSDTWKTTPASTTLEFSTGRSIWS